MILYKSNLGIIWVILHQLKQFSLKLYWTNNGYYNLKKLHVIGLIMITKVENFSY